jgi:hypothetical protein
MNSPFRDWLYSESVFVLAKKIRVTARTIGRWRSGESSPGLQNRDDIVRLTKGKITHTDIVTHYYNLKTK